MMKSVMLLASLALVVTGSNTRSQPSAPPPAVLAPGAPATPPTPPPPPSPVTGIRNKISAGDLLSAESILEVHRAKYGNDGPALVGLSWLARGALLLGEPGKARRFAEAVLGECGRRDSTGTELEKNHDLETAAGNAIEVVAQLVAAEAGPMASAALLRRELARIGGPVALRSRLQKRLNLMQLGGSPTPELVPEDFLGSPPPTLASLTGRPVLLFCFAEWCGDCKAMAPTLARAKRRYAGRGLQLIALSRYYDEAALRLKEKARVDSVWKAVYAELGDTPIVLSTASMERFGGSSTPTFVCIDRQGVVRDYTPTRLTEAELDRRLELITNERGRR